VGTEELLFLVKSHQRITSVVELGETELVGGRRAAAGRGVDTGLGGVEASRLVEQLRLNVLNGGVQEGCSNLRLAASASTFLLRSVIMTTILSRASEKAHYGTGVSSRGFVASSGMAADGDGFGGAQGSRWDVENGGAAQEIHPD
jgi:hypothetical protein